MDKRSVLSFTVAKMNSVDIYEKKLELRNQIFIKLGKQNGFRFSFEKTTIEILHGILLVLAGMAAEYNKMLLETYGAVSRIPIR